MKRLLVLALVAVAALLASRRPSAPAVASVTPVKNAASQHFHKGHSSRSATGDTVVYVVGAVARPGLYRVPAGARVNDAIQRAGGLRAEADPAAVNLAERVSDGEEIRVLRLGETGAPARKSTRRAARKALPAAAPIDLNAADAQALASIPGIGPTLAARIVEFRRINGPFASLDELADVAGMTQRRIDAMSAYVTVGS
jgi:competence protein ComEA